VVDKIDGFDSLQAWLLQLKNGKLKPPEREQVIKYFSHVLSESFAFELYNHESENLKRFYSAIETFVQSRQ
jgi:hypothetical protein